MKNSLENFLAVVGADGTTYIAYNVISDIVEIDATDTEGVRYKLVKTNGQRINIEGDAANLLIYRQLHPKDFVKR